jgi:hypothetical protein
MKTSRKKNVGQSRAASGTRDEGGFVATVMFIGLLVVMLMLATAGGMALIHLHDEVKVLEQQQIKRLDLSVTNSVAVVQMGVAKINTK